MKNLKISTSIALSLLLPIVGLVLFSGSMVLDKRHTATDMQGLHDLAQLAPVISNLAHELQMERGASAVFIGSKGKKLKEELPQQFTITDAKKDAFIATLHRYDASAFNVAAPVAAAPETPDGEAQAAAQPEQGEVEGAPLIPLPEGVANELVEKMNVAIDALNAIEKTRGKTLKRRSTVLNMAKYYTTTITKLMAIVEEMTVLSSTAQVTDSHCRVHQLFAGQGARGD